MAGSRTPDPGAKRRTFAIAVLVVSTYLVMTANGGMFLLVVSLKEMAGDFGWPRAVPSLAYAFFFAGAGIGGIVMGWWYDRSGAGPVAGRRCGRWRREAEGGTTSVNGRGLRGSVAWLIDDRVHLHHRFNR